MAIIRYAQLPIRKLWCLTWPLAGQQGMFGQILSMNNFAKASGVTGIQNPTLSGLLTSILELGAWVGVLANGILADTLGKLLTVSPLSPRSHHI